jgi:RluA family pseudouridine synthase
MAGAERLLLMTRVPAAGDGTSLLDFLAGRFRYHDRAAWELRIARGDVKVDGRLASGWLRLRRGMRVSYESEHREPAVPTDIPVLFESAGVLCVDKPAGLPVHADGVFIRHTLVHLLRQRGPHLAGVQPAHRLDRETSGVLVLGKDKATARDLQRCFQAGSVAKRYLAVVRGSVGPDQLVLCGGLVPGSGRIVLRREVVAEGSGQPARTEARVLRRARSCTLLEVVPHSGRTHQIRAHLAAAGHPLVGEVLYGRTDDDYLAFVRHVKAGGDPAWPAGRDAPRHLLHAARVEIAAAQPPLAVEAPMPADMQHHLDAN